MVIIFALYVTITHEIRSYHDNKNNMEKSPKEASEGKMIRKRRATTKNKQN